MQHKERIMKRNFLITLLLTFTMLFVTACSTTDTKKENSNNSKFEGTWVAYDTTHDNHSIKELIIENIDGQLLASLYNYSYSPLMDYFSSGLEEADNNKSGGDTAPANADYLLTKYSDSIHNMLVSADGNKLDVGAIPIIYNEKDGTLVFDKIVFKKKSDDNTVQAHLQALKDNMKKIVIEERKKATFGSFRPKPTIQFDFSFNDSILDTIK